MLQSASGQSVPFAWSFTVATEDTVGAAGGSSIPASDPADYQSFRSRPDLKPPTVTVTTHRQGTSAGDIFLAPYSGPGQYGPMILDEDGSLIWFKALAPGARAADFRVQEYEGRPVLTWWQDPLVYGGSVTAGIVIANSAYQDIDVVRAGNGYQPDLHEFQITPQGTALITVYDGIDCDLSSVGGPQDGAVVDTLLQEIDLRTGLVMYEWHSLDHVALSASYASGVQSSLQTPFDFFHINSIVPGAGRGPAGGLPQHVGRLRPRPPHRAGALDVGRQAQQLAMGPGTRTAWQHDARRQPDGTITFFDNGATPRVHPESRAVQISLNTQAMTATLACAK